MSIAKEERNNWRERLLSPYNCFNESLADFTIRLLDDFDTYEDQCSNQIGSSLATGVDDGGMIKDVPHIMCNKDGVKCPYCGSVEEIEHDEGYGYEEDELYNQECGKCGKTFIYKTIVYREYFPEIAPCLNGEAEHAWKKCDPIAEVCGVCGEKRRRKDWKENLKKIGMIVIPRKTNRRCANSTRTIVLGQALFQNR